MRYLTGHVRDAVEAWSDLDDTIAVAADPHTTLIVYMGLGLLPELVATLGRSGMDLEHTPAVAVERGTTAQQRVVGATLGKLPQAVQRAGLVSPTLLILGKVCALSPHYARWLAAGAAGGAVEGRAATWREGNSNTTIKNVSGEEEEEEALLEQRRVEELAALAQWAAERRTPS